MKFFTGILLGLLMFPAIHEVSLEIYKDTPILVQYGFTKPFTKKCVKNIGKNGHGWEFVVREYYSCGKISIFISNLLWGEYIERRDK